MSTAADSQRATQTPGQWAVRWFGVVVAAALCASVPLVHVVWHGLLGNAEPLLRTRSQLPAPAATAASLADGSWMLAKEKQLREDSPITWWLRSNWNELRYRLGAPESAQVHFGKDEWFYIRESVLPDRAAWDRAAPTRRAFVADVRDLVQRAGAELFVLLVPDKSRVHPEACYPRGELPPEKRGNYAAAIAEIEALGIPTVDLAAVMAAARASDPATELYYRRDTHWRPAGALAAGRAVAAALEARYGERLGPRATMRLRGPLTARLVGDLPANMGIATLELPDPVLGRRTAPMSLLADRLSEVREYWDVEMETPAGPRLVDGTDADAPVWMLSTSFGEENGVDAIAYWLGRSLRTTTAYGAVGLEPLRRALPELRNGTRSKVVIWEIVERGLFDPVWREQKL